MQIIKRLVLYFIVTLATLILLSTIFCVPTMLAWNFVVPTLGLSAINLGQAIAINFLVALFAFFIRVDIPGTISDNTEAIEDFLFWKSLDE